MTSRGEKRSVESRVELMLNELQPVIHRLWHARRMIAYVNLGVMAVTLVFAFFVLSPQYESKISILPEYGGKSNLSTLGDLATLAGISGASSPIEIYQDLLNSESVMARVLSSKYKTQKYRDSVNLIQYCDISTGLNIPVETRERKIFLDTYKAVLSQIETKIDPTTSILTITVTMPESQLSADVANRVVESLDSYVRTQRKSYASNQRYYLEIRLGQIRDSLTIAEENLKSFNESNVVINQSAELMLEQSRLTRTAEILQAVYIELTKQLELVKLDEVRDSPVLNIKESAKDPLVRAGPSRKKILFLVMVVSLVLSCGYVASEPTVRNLWRIVGNLGLTAPRSSDNTPEN